MAKVSKVPQRNTEAAPAVSLERKQLNVEILAVVDNALDVDAKARGLPKKTLLENILAAYYDFPDLIVESKAINRARTLLEKHGFRVDRINKGVVIGDDEIRDS